MRHSLLIVLLMTLAAGFILLRHQVETGLTPQDRQIIAAFLDRNAIARPGGDYKEQLDFIRAVQAALLREAPVMAGIPQNQPREPADLLNGRSGMCFDRSRVIEKIMRYAGLPARHVYLILRRKGESWNDTLLAADRPSHAASEVLTRRGWLVVDSNAPWLALDRQGRPLAIADVLTPGSFLRWEQPAPHPLYVSPALAIYGLYARHGRFYPPYNALPDVNYRELAQNFAD